MDFGDLAADSTEQFTELRLQQIRKAAKDTPKFPLTGKCYYCEDATPGIFCDNFCRNAYKKQQGVSDV